MPGNLTRRDFLARGSTLTVGAALGAAGWAATRSAAQSREQDVLPTVYRVRANGVVTGRRVHERVLADMLERGLAIATGTSSGAEAWHKVLKADDVVGLKFNRSGAEGLGTTMALAGVMIDSLTKAGFEPSRLVPIEVPDAIYRERGVPRPATGWATKETPFGSGSDRLSAVLEQVTAIINVPFLKTHNIAGLTCCLKNLSHALVKHPARFHDNHCSPYIADIVALPQIRDKLRLNIVNALRVVFDGGPEATETLTHDSETLLFSFDPVALDSMSLEEINLVRRAHALEPIKRYGGMLGYLRAAYEQGLGQADVHNILFKKVVL